jgi:hypothetical protein
MAARALRRKEPFPGAAITASDSTGRARRSLECENVRRDRVCLLGRNPERRHSAIRDPIEDQRAHGVLRSRSGSLHVDDGRTVAAAAPIVAVAAGAARLILPLSGIDRLG